MNSNVAMHVIILDSALATPSNRDANTGKCLVYAILLLL